MTRRVVRHVAAAVLALSLPLSNPSFAQTADRFDLICAGVRRDMVSGERKDVTVRVRVDLASQHFCFDECDEYGHVYPIADPNSKTIAYDFDVDKTGPDHQAGAYRSGDSEYFWPQREHVVIGLDELTLRHDYEFDSGEPASQHFYLKWRLACTRAPFGSNIYNKNPMIHRLEDYSDTPP